MNSVYVNESGYKFGFNGQMKDDEIYGPGNAYSAQYWEYDARLGRRWNLDPIPYPFQSSYCVFNNNPIYFVDPEGLEGQKPNKSNKINFGLFTIEKRQHLKGFSFEWNTNFHTAFMASVGGLRKAFTGAERNLSLVPMGDFRNREEQLGSSIGSSDFSYDPDNISLYRFRRLRFEANELRKLPDVDFTVYGKNKKGNYGFIDYVIPLFIGGSDNSGQTDVAGFYFTGSTGFTPFLNSFLYYKAMQYWTQGKPKEFLYSIAASKVNSMYSRPYQNQTTQFRVITGDDVNYSVYIKYRYWQNYALGNRPKYHKFLYGTN